MTAGIAEARKRLASARARLDARPRARTVASLATVMDDWCKPDSRWQRRLIDTLPAAAGFSSKNVREGLARALAGWTGEAVRSLVSSELGSLARAETFAGFDQTSVLLAGSIPMPTIATLIAPLLLHSPVLVKPASRDTVTAGVFAESLAEVDPDLGAAVEIVSFSRDDAAAARAFFEANCVVATGSDETIAEARRRVPTGAHVVAYGHRLSIAALGESALEPARREDVARDLALDIALWDQLGCSSPVAIFCLGEADASFAGTLADALAETETRLPLGELSLQAAASIRRERDEAQMRRAGGADVVVHAGDGLRWTVVHEADAVWRPAPLHRFVRIHPVADPAGLRTAIAPVSKHLATIAYAGLPEDALAGLGASRLCAPGAMQTPPLDWQRDDQPVILPLARVANDGR